MTKKEQRAYIKQLLKGKSTEEFLEASVLASQRLISLPQFENANAFLAYMALPRECDPSEVVKKAREIGIAVAFPLCVDGNRIKICVPYSEECFVTGAYGITEPDPDRSAILSPNDLDLIIVPGLGFDSECRRLGRGAGYYDRLLCESRAYKVGFCFDEQIFDEICTEEHDVTLDCVVTSERVFYKN